MLGELPTAFVMNLFYELFIRDMRFNYDKPSLPFLLYTSSLESFRMKCYFKMDTHSIGPKSRD